tara:strand:- start:112 stop:477 length:366 start_codon:yes stop_codon:yes gene_type:complete
MSDAILSIPKITNCPTPEQVEQAKAILQAQADAEMAKKQNTTLSCYHCKTEHRVGDSVLFQVERYVEPYGCTGGDYYEYVEGSDHIECSNCKRRLHLPFFMQGQRYDKSRIGAFKAVEAKS